MEDQSLKEVHFGKRFDGEVFKSDLDSPNF